jgi:EAL domain-containing protein (putative c-di-GMP-specific phosphodiesterase class I)
VRKRGDKVTDTLSEAALRHGLAAGEFWPAFQPQLNLVSGHVSGFEVLARWDSRSMVVSLRPASFRWPNAAAYCMPCC